MEYFPPDSPTSELEVDETGEGPPPAQGTSPSGRKLTEAQEHYSKHHADWLPKALKSDLTIASASPVAASPAAGTTASTRKSRFGLLVPASPAFVAGGSLHSTSTQNKAVLLPPTLSSSSSPSSSSPSWTGVTSSSSLTPNASGSTPSGSPSSKATDTVTAAGGAADSASSSSSASSSPASATASAGKQQIPNASPSASPRPPLNIDSRTVLNAAVGAGQTRTLSSTGGLSGSVKTLENSSASAAAGALVSAAFGRGAAVTGTTPQSAKFAAAAAAAEAAARAAAAGRTEKGLPMDALVDGLPVQSFSHLRVMKEGTCVEVFCLPLLFQQARSSGRLILGRAEAADIPTEHPSCSRLHCELKRSPLPSSNNVDNGSGGPEKTTSPSTNMSTRFVYTLKDLGSGHGTLINGGRVAAGKDTPLEDEDEIQLGFSQRLYLFFTGKDTFGPDTIPTPPPSNKESPSAKSTSLRKQQTPQGVRSRSSSTGSITDPSSSVLPPPPPLSGPVPPSTPPPAPPPPLPCDDPTVNPRQQQHQGAMSGVIGGTAAGDTTRMSLDTERRNSDSENRWLSRQTTGIDRSTTADPENRWLSHQQRMEQLRHQRMTAFSATTPLSPMATAAAAESEPAMMLQQHHAYQQQREGFTEDMGSNGCTNSSPVGAGGAGGVGWGWDNAAQQQQFLYWQQQQQGLSPGSGWETGQIWGAASVQDPTMQQYMADQYAGVDQQCWDSTAGVQQQQQHWNSQQQQSMEEMYTPEHHQRRSGWSSMPPWPEGQQEESQKGDGAQQQQHMNHHHIDNRSSEIGDNWGRGGGGQGGSTRGDGGGGGGIPPFKRRSSTAAARKLLWQHAGKKQQGDETSGASAGEAVATVDGSKKLRLDGAKVALWGGRTLLDGTAEEGRGRTDPPGTAATSMGTEGKKEEAVAGNTTSSDNSGRQLSLSSNIGLNKSGFSPSSFSGGGGGRKQSSDNHSIGSNTEETGSQRVFCAHILLSFVRREDTEPWKGSKSIYRNNTSGERLLLVGRGGRAVTRSRTDALSSLNSVKDITAEDQTQFGEFAVELSDCPSSKKRGVLGWVHAGQPGGRSAALLQQQQNSNSNNNTKELHIPQRRTATEVAAQPINVNTDTPSSSSSKTIEEKQEDWWLPQEAVDAAMHLQVGELSDVIESENGAHLLLRLK